jgi:hypothetical protein
VTKLNEMEHVFYPHPKTFKMMRLMNMITSWNDSLVLSLLPVSQAEEANTFNTKNFPFPLT